MITPRLGTGFSCKGHVKLVSERRNRKTGPHFRFDKYGDFSFEEVRKLLNDKQVVNSPQSLAR